MLSFKEIEISDKGWIDKLLSYSGYRGCEYCFTNAYIWRKSFDITVGRYEDFVIFKHGSRFVFPAGSGDISAVINALKHYCDENGIPLSFNSMDITAKKTLEEKYPGLFTFSTNEDMYDYVYDAQSLITLAGKRLHSKRNYINRFKTLDWSFERITPDNIGQCINMCAAWGEVNGAAGNDEKSGEISAVTDGLEHFFELGLSGGILKVEGDIQAFSYGERLTEDTFVTHAEKAFTVYDGAYPMINMLMANEYCQGLKYINREEDMGEENLRKAKRSYCPCFMVEKFSAVYNGGKGNL